MSTAIIREGEPTAEDCTASAFISVASGGQVFEGHACWYPQMGGYVGKALVMVREGSGCADVLVWHDGEFPFGLPDRTDSPTELHHCSGEQFIRFGEQLKAWGCD